ncbi:hypothetical protein BCC0238_003647 [Burkholderia gladioli]
MLVPRNRARDGLIYLVNRMVDKNAIEALQRAMRVADQSCTAYSALRDRFRAWSTTLDLTILLISAWLVAMVFVQPAIAVELSPRGISKDIWLGLLSIGAFSLSLIQLQVDWKGRAQTYQQAAATLSAFVKEYRPLASEGESTIVGQALLRYQLITDALEPIPESQFLKLKKRHKLKVEVSRHLDTHPGTNIWLVRAVLWWRDNRATLRFPASDQHKDSHQ